MTLTGPLRTPKQLLGGQSYGGHASLHDDSVASALGFSGAPIEGPTHFSQFVPLFLTLWGTPWLERGCISAHFQGICVEGDQTVAEVSLDGRRSNIAKIRMTKQDGTPVLKGTASIGPTSEEFAHEVSDRLGRITPPQALRILDQLELGPLRGEELVRIGFHEKLGALYPFTLSDKLTLITEPLTWQEENTADSPWSDSVLPLEMASVLTQYTSASRFPVREPSVAMFLDLEVCLLKGPLFVDREYLLTREVVGLSESKRTESFWTRTTVREPATGRPIATVLLHTGLLKQSYPG
jgi:hypothetical protein